MIHLALTFHGLIRILAGEMRGTAHRLTLMHNTGVMKKYTSSPSRIKVKEQLDAPWEKSKGRESLERRSSEGFMQVQMYVVVGRSWRRLMNWVGEKQSMCIRRIIVSGSRGTALPMVNAYLWKGSLCLKKIKTRLHSSQCFSPRTWTHSHFITSPCCQTPIWIRLTLLYSLTLFQTFSSWQKSYLYMHVGCDFSFTFIPYKTERS